MSQQDIIIIVHNLLIKERQPSSIVFMRGMPSWVLTISVDQHSHVNIHCLQLGTGVDVTGQI